MFVEMSPEQEGARCLQEAGEGAWSCAGAAAGDGSSAANSRLVVERFGPVLLAAQSAVRPWSFCSKL